MPESEIGPAMGPGDWAACEHTEGYMGDSESELGRTRGGVYLFILQIVSGLGLLWPTHMSCAKLVSSDFKMYLGANPAQNSSSAVVFSVTLLTELSSAF